jgi:periplasmic divalent cation tolerance protein
VARRTRPTASPPRSSTVASRHASNELPIRSTYRWEGVVQHDDEVLLLVKTVAARFDDVAATVRELHSYDVPAITAVPIVRGSDDYLAWIDAET